MIDTHAHLDGCVEPAADLLARARAAGVTRVVTIGTGLDSCRRAIELTDMHEEVYAALGIDPHQAAGAEAERVEELRTLLAHPKAVAVGETGLDFFRDHASPEAQQRLFEAQLELAADLGKPVVIHTREADAATAAALVGYPGAVILHCFSSPGLLDAALDHGWYVSFAGNVTYPSARELREAAARVPIDRLLAETDSPYLAPQPVRGRPNEPAHVVHTVAVLAETRAEHPVGLAEQIDRNATAAFGLP